MLVEQRRLVDAVGAHRSVDPGDPVVLEGHGLPALEHLAIHLQDLRLLLLRAEFRGEDGLAEELVHRAAHPRGVGRVESQVIGVQVLGEDGHGGGVDHRLQQPPVALQVRHGLLPVGDVLGESDQPHDLPLLVQQGALEHTVDAHRAVRERVGHARRLADLAIAKHLRIHGGKARQLLPRADRCRCRGEQVHGLLADEGRFLQPVAVRHDLVHHQVAALHILHVEPVGNRVEHGVQGALTGPQPLFGALALADVMDAGEDDRLSVQRDGADPQGRFERRAVLGLHADFVVGEGFTVMELPHQRLPLLRRPVELRDAAPGGLGVGDAHQRCIPGIAVQDLPGIDAVQHQGHGGPVHHQCNGLQGIGIHGSKAIRCWLPP